MNIGNFFRKVKEDKEFRFDFIIGVWSAIIICAIIFAIIYISMMLLGKGKSEDLSKPTPSPEITEEMEDAGTDDEPSPTPVVEIEEDEEDDGERRFDENIDGDIEFEENENSVTTLYATTTVNVRSKPDTTSNTVGRLAKGEAVELVEKLNTGWTKVKYNNTEAYVKSEYLSDGGNSYSVATYAPNDSQMSTTTITTKAPSSTATPAAAKPTATPKPKATKKPKVTAPPEEDEDDEPDTSETQTDSSSNKEPAPTEPPVNNPPASDASSNTPVPDTTVAPAVPDNENVTE